MKKILSLFSLFLIGGCSDENYSSKQEQLFVKACNVNPISKSECRCIYSDLIKNVYSEQEMEKILNNDIALSQMNDVKNQLRDNILRSYAQCKK